MLPRIFLIAAAALDPMVRMRVLLLYPGRNEPYPDRPFALQYHMEFYVRIRDEEDKSSKEARDNMIAVRLFIRAAIHGEVPNESWASDKEKARAAIQKFKCNLKTLRDMISDVWVKTLIEIFEEELESFVSSPKEKARSSSTPTPMSSNKPFSWWDIVPVVGSVRTLDDAVECAKNDDVAGAAINTVLGIDLGNRILSRCS